MPEIAADDPGSPDELAAYAHNGSVWVAADDDDRPIAYLLSMAVDDCAHIEQVSVEPGHARRGIGAALIDHLAATARDEGRVGPQPDHVPSTCHGTPRTTRGSGFDVVDPAAYGPQLAELVAHEAQMIPATRRGS